MSRKIMCVLGSGLILAFVAVLAHAAPAAETEEKYPDKYDYIDADGILANDRLRNQYYHCFMEEAPCMTPDAAFFKSHLAEAFATKCKKCTEKQKHMFDAIADWYSTNSPEQWIAIIKKSINEARKLHL